VRINIHERRSRLANTPLLVRSLVGWLVAIPSCVHTEYIYIYIYIYSPTTLSIYPSLGSVRSSWVVTNPTYEPRAWLSPSPTQQKQFWRRAHRRCCPRPRPRYRCGALGFVAGLTRLHVARRSRPQRDRPTRFPTVARVSPNRPSGWSIGWGWLWSHSLGLSFVRSFCLRSSATPCAQRGM